MTTTHLALWERAGATAWLESAVVPLLDDGIPNRAPSLMPALANREIDFLALLVPVDEPDIFKMTTNRQATTSPTALRCCVNNHSVTPKGPNESLGEHRGL